MRVSYKSTSSPQWCRLWEKYKTWEWVTSQHQVHNDVGRERNTKHESELQVNIYISLHNLLCSPHCQTCSKSRDSTQCSCNITNYTSLIESAVREIQNMRVSYKSTSSPQWCRPWEKYKTWEWVTSQPQWCRLWVHNGWREKPWCRLWEKYKTWEWVTSQHQVHNDVGRERNTKHESELQVNIKSTMM